MGLLFVSEDGMDHLCFFSDVVFSCRGSSGRGIGILGIVYGIDHDPIGPAPFYERKAIRLPLVERLWGRDPGMDMLCAFVDRVWKWSMAPMGISNYGLEGSGSNDVCKVRGE